MIILTLVDDLFLIYQKQMIVKIKNHTVILHGFLLGD